MDFAAGDQPSWLREQGIGFFPVVGWAGRGGYTANGHGNSVPRFHIVWSTGPAIIEPFLHRPHRRAGYRRAAALTRLRSPGADLGRDSCRQPT